MIVLRCLLFSIALYGAGAAAFLALAEVEHLSPRWLRRAAAATARAVRRASRTGRTHTPAHRKHKRGHRRA